MKKISIITAASILSVALSTSVFAAGSEFKLPADQRQLVKSEIIKTIDYLVDIETKYEKIDKLSKENPALSDQELFAKLNINLSELIQRNTLVQSLQPGSMYVLGKAVGGKVIDVDVNDDKFVVAYSDPANNNGTILTKEYSLDEMRGILISDENIDDIFFISLKSAKEENNDFTYDDKGNVTFRGTTYTPSQLLNTFIYDIADEKQLEIPKGALISKADKTALLNSDTKVEKIKTQGDKVELIDKDGNVLETLSKAQLENKLDGINQAANTYNSAKAPDNSVTEAVISASSPLKASIGGRAAVNTLAMGSSSGDMLQTFGVWTKAVGGKVDHKNTKTLGFKATEMGFSAGIDTPFSEEGFVGIAYTFAKNDLKYKVKTGSEKADSKTHFATVYAGFNFDGVYLNVQGSYGMGKIERERTYGVLNTKYKSSPKANIMDFTSKVGANIDVGSGLIVDPFVGLNYTNATIKKYSETGGPLTRSVEERKVHKTSADLGVALKSKIESGDDSFLVPEIHGGLNYAFSEKNAPTVYKIKGIDTSFTAKSVKNSEKKLYNVGVALEFMSKDSLSLSVGYDHNRNKNLKSHSGFLKAKFNI